MSYQVIARKWRPKTFEDVVGQDHVVKTMRNAIEQNRLAQAYLLCGPRGTGKTTLARIFAKALNCEKGPTIVPCCQCNNCKEIDSGSSLDVIEIDGASNNKVEDVHQKILETVNFAPVAGKFKIYYIDEVHMLTNQAFNALLKTIEEPPAHARFIFATTEADKVIGTIVSRCQRFDLRRIAIPEISGQLRKISDAEGITIDDDAIYALARGADGGMRDAESALDQIISYTGSNITEQDVLGVFGLVSREAIEGIAEAVLSSDIPRIINLISSLDSSGKDLRRLTAELIAHFRNILIYIQMGGYDPSLNLTDAQIETLKKQAAITNTAAVLSVTENLIELDGKLRLSLSPRILLETALIRSAKSASVVDLEKILKKLTNLKLELGGGDAATTASPVRQSIASTSTTYIAKQNPTPFAPTRPSPVASTPNKPAVISPVAPLPEEEQLPPTAKDYEDQPTKEKSQLDDIESDIALRKRVEAHPIVQEAISLFDGVIRGVKK